MRLVFWGGALAVGAQVTVGYSVTVTAAGNHVLTSTAVADTPGSNCRTGSTDPRCAVTVLVAALAQGGCAVSCGATAERLASTAPLTDSAS